MHALASQHMKHVRPAWKPSRIDPLEMGRPSRPLELASDGPMAYSRWTNRVLFFVLLLFIGLLLPAFQTSRLAAFSPTFPALGDPHGSWYWPFHA